MRPIHAFRPPPRHLLFRFFATDMRSSRRPRLDRTLSSATVRSTKTGQIQWLVLVNPETMAYLEFSGGERSKNLRLPRATDGDTLGKPPRRLTRTERRPRWCAITVHRFNGNRA